MAIYSSRMVFSFGTNRNMLQHIGIRFPFLYSLLPLNEYSVAKNKKRASLDSSLHQINKAYEKEVFPSRGYTFLTQATFCLLYDSDKKIRIIISDIRKLLSLNHLFILYFASYQAAIRTYSSPSCEYA